MNKAMSLNECVAEIFTRRVPSVKRGDILIRRGYRVRLDEYGHEVGGHLPNFKVLSYGHSGPVPGKLHVKLCGPDE